MESDERYLRSLRGRQCVGFRCAAITIISILAICVLRGVGAWSYRKIAIHHSKICAPSEKWSAVHSRRNFVAIASFWSGAGPLLMDTKVSNANENRIDADEAKQKFVSARKELRKLIDDYSEITAKGGGDAVRNRLGTQGVNSNLFGIQKVLKILTTEAEDIVEYTETMEEFNAYYFQAEGAAYQSLFVEHSSAKSTPESLLKTAKADIIQMEKYMDQLAVQLNL